MATHQHSPTNLVACCVLLRGILDFVVLEWNLADRATMLTMASVHLDAHASQQLGAIAHASAFYDANS